MADHLSPQCRAILAALRRYPRGLTGLELFRETGVLRYSARIMELRAAGYVITVTELPIRGRTKTFRHVLEEPAVQMEAFG